MSFNCIKVTHVPATVKFAETAELWFSCISLVILRGILWFCVDVCDYVILEYRSIHGNWRVAAHANPAPTTLTLGLIHARTALPPFSCAASASPATEAVTHLWVYLEARACMRRGNSSVVRPSSRIAPLPKAFLYLHFYQLYQVSCVRTYILGILQLYTHGQGFQIWLHCVNMVTLLGSWR